MILLPGGVQLAGQHLDLPLLPAVFVEVQSLLHRQDQLLFIIGLQQVIQGPEGDGFPGVGKLVEGRQEQDHAGTAALADAAGHLQAAHAGHLDVQDGHLGMEGLEKIHRFPAVFGFQHRAAVRQVLLNVFGEDFALNGFVLCHKNLIHIHSSPPCFWGMAHWMTVPRFGLL